jgi:hypothetical protein
MALFLRLTVFAFAASLAGPALAGDQPVVIKLPLPPTYDYGGVHTTGGVDPVHSRVDTLTGIPVAAPAPAAGVAMAAPGDRGVARAAAGVSGVRSADALYAQVLAEAKARGLR